MKDLFVVICGNSYQETLYIVRARNNEEARSLFGTEVVNSIVKLTLYPRAVILYQKYIGE